MKTRLFKAERRKAITQGLLKQRRAAISVWVTAALILLGSWGANAFGFRINTTPSVPVGLWRLSQADPIDRGRVVSVCPEPSPLFQRAKDRGYLHTGDCPGCMTPVFKPVAALPGDTVTIDDVGMAVNGERLPNSQARLTDASNRPMPRLPHGRYRVRPGMVWLVSNLPNSFDSRYFGPVPFRQIQGTLTPLVVEGHP